MYENAPAAIFTMNVCPNDLKAKAKAKANV